MTSRGNNNSFIILTTLGVYLGLLLVGGAAPQVLAHSAMTRNFEIADEIEVKDDLDNKPDSVEEVLTASASSFDYSGIVRDYLASSAVVSPTLLLPESLAVFSHSNPTAYSGPIRGFAFTGALTKIQFPRSGLDPLIASAQ